MNCGLCIPRPAPAACRRPGGAAGRRGTCPRGRGNAGLRPSRRARRPSPGGARA